MQTNAMEEKFLNAFNLVPNIGPAKFKKILAFFDSAESAWQAPESSFKEAGLDQEWITNFLIKRQSLDPEVEFKKLRAEDINILTINDPAYPQRLKEIYDPPQLLYIKGELKADDDFSMGIVGSRKMSIYGQQATPELTKNLARAGLTIISGLARGIDTLAHKTALEAGGRTIAIIGSGIDSQSIYPPQNKLLAEKISQQGAVISEFPIGTLPLAHHFPLRNRIISGLSLGVLVIEAQEKSGALITAHHALAQNREVFALPGSIYSPSSNGTNKLIQQGAKLVRSADDILEELNLTQAILLPEKRKIIASTPEEEKVLNSLSGEPLHIDKIIESTNMEASAASALLLQMEMAGKIKSLGGMNFIKS